MKREELKHQIFTIPNILTYIRALSAPVFMAFTIIKAYRTDIGGYQIPLIGLIIMVVAASTDLLDGWVARTFNQGSDLGVMLDPVADKLMHVCAILSLVIIGYVHWAFVVALFLKEATMVVGGVFMASNSKLIKAHVLGKVASATLSVAVFMSYFHPFFADKVFYLDWIVMGIGMVLTYTAFFSYLKQSVMIINKIFADKKLKNGTGNGEHKG
jgi:Phosphatidylglycerophosphate synthase